jgi:hypothetical protein
LKRQHKKFNGGWSGSGAILLAISFNIGTNQPHQFPLLKESPNNVLANLKMTRTEKRSSQLFRARAPQKNFLEPEKVENKIKIQLTR